MAAKATTDYDVGPNSNIISGVLDGVKQSFIDSGVDLEVLSMLKELWVTKLRSNTAQSTRIGDSPGFQSDVKIEGLHAGKAEKKVDDLQREHDYSKKHTKCDESISEERGGGLVKEFGEVHP